MRLEMPVAPDRESLDTIEGALETMLARLKEILEASALTQETLIEITAIYNNVAYIFLYLEANDEYVGYDRLLPWRDAFHADDQLDDLVIERLTRLRCADPEAEESRLSYLNELRDKRAARERGDTGELDRLLAAAKDVLAETRREHNTLLVRLGVDAGGSPQAAFYRLLATTPRAGTRTKLARAWTARRDDRRDTLIGLIDGMVTLRRDRARAAGHRSVLAQTLTKSQVDEAEVDRFLAGFLRAAAAGHTELEDEVASVLGVPDDPFLHFGHYLRTITDEQPMPRFSLDAAMSYAFTVAEAVFGLTVRRVDTGSPHVLGVEVYRDGEEVGRVNFDLWDMDRKTVEANHTRGLRNRTDFSDFVQHPVAFVSCRFRRQHDAANLITFQNLHSLFHEFGHALNHLLIRKRISNRSGLEYLPLERLENFSMWYEKWVYHPEAADHLGLTGDERAGLDVAQRVKALEFRRTAVDRAVSALLDFELHRRGRGGMTDVFDDLDQRYGIGRHCALGDFPAYFTWPMYVAQPGANFSYAWGAADSCQRFAPFRALSLADIRRDTGLRELFSPCFDFNAAGSRPDSAAVFAFYEPIGRATCVAPA
jgi:oligopeptidase A